MQYQIITTNTHLAEYCQHSLQSDYIALDTEFVRTRTFYPQCGLIQINNGNQIVLVDPLAISQWEPFIALMKNPSVVKVLHSCSEDLEVFLHLLNCVPTPLFDTQFAACMAGLGNTLGYAKLVSDLLGIDLDKGESRTDWLRRPLSEEQLQYAANDVEYLFQVYPMIKDKLVKNARYDWVAQDSAQLAGRKLSGLPAEYRYLTIKNIWQLDPRSLAAIAVLAKWRFELAQEKDLALNFVVKETALLEIARSLPVSMSKLHGLGCLSGKEMRLYGHQIVAMINDVVALSEDECPAKVKRLIDIKSYKKICQAIRNECIAIADAQQLPVEILASKKQINQFLKWRWFDVEECKIQGIKPDLCTGWRGPLLVDVLNVYQ